MEVNLEGSELLTSVVGLALRGCLNLPGSKSQDYSKRLGNVLSCILEHGNEKESTDPKYNFNYVTMEVNMEGSKLPAYAVGLALRGSLNLPGNKSADYSKRLVTLAT